jgi:hypothetical protein
MLNQIFLIIIFSFTPYRNYLLNVGRISELYHGIEFLNSILSGDVLPPSSEICTNTTFVLSILETDSSKREGLQRV